MRLIQQRLSELMTVKYMYKDNNSNNNNNNNNNNK